MMQQCDLVCIGACGIRIIQSMSYEIEEQFLPFLTETCCQNEVRFEAVNNIPVIGAEDLVTEQDVMYSEYLIDNEYIRTFHGTGTKEPYAVLKKIEPGQWELRYLKSYEKYFKSMGKCFGHIALERMLMEQETAILHASFVEYEEKGILFTGPSGIGKSTQAELWKQYEHSEVLNGDRTILKKKDGIWYAYGSPYAGSSKIYKNKCVPIRAIAVLGKAPVDRCIRLTLGQAFRAIYSQMTLNIWNNHFMECAMNMIQGLAMEVPVFQLECTPRESAVIALKQSLEQLQER